MKKDLIIQSIALVCMAVAGDVSAQSRADARQDVTAPPVISADRGSEKFLGEAANGGFTLYGVVADAAKGIDYGMYGFEPVSGLTFSPVKISDKFGNFGAYGEGRYYTMVTNDDYSVEYITYDAETWEVIGRVAKSTKKSDATCGFAFDPETERIYGIANVSDGRWPDYKLAIYDTETWDYEVIGATESLFAIAFDKKGVLYGIDDNGNFCSVDKSSGEVSIIRNVGITPAFAQSSACDYRTGNFYWASFSMGSNNYVSTLYSVDVATGNLTKVADLSSSIEVVGMFSKNSYLSDDAPEQPEVAVSYKSNGSLDATIDFTAPSATLGGNSLSGTVEMSMSVGGEVVATKSVSPGGSGHFDYVFPERGKYTVVVRANNAAGRGQRTVVETFAGKDAPDSASDVRLTIDDATNKAQLRWEAPTEGENGGYLDVAALVYDVIRFPDSTLVATTPKLEFNEQLGSTLKSYSYKVIAKVGEYEGKEAWSNAVIHGDPIPMPYTGTFENKYDLPLYGIVDANGDGNQFHWISSSLGQYMQYAANETGSDDWLLTPALQVDNKHVYKLSFDATPSWTFSQKLTITIGKGANVGSQTQSILELNDFISDSRVVQSAYFTPKESGANNIGFHVTNSTPQSLLNVYSISIEEFAAIAAPNSVKNLAVTSVGGELRATISFTLPSLTIEGKQLSNLNVDIYRNGDLIKSERNLSAGDDYSFVDEHGLAGLNTYTIVPTNDAGTGWQTSADRFLGYDSPSDVAELEARWADSSHKAKLVWKAPSQGVNGGNINGESLTYSVFVGETWDQVEIAKGVESCSYEADVAQYTESGTSEWINFTVKAETSEGVSEGMSTVIPLGVFPKAPLVESFANMSMEIGDWTFEKIEGANAWLKDDGSFREEVSPFDDDAGMLLFCKRYSFGTEGEKRSITRYKSPGIDISGLDDPVLAFYLYQDESMPDELTLQVEATTDGFEYKAISEPIFANSANGWQLVRIPLTEFKGAAMLGISFLGKTPNNQCLLFYRPHIR